MKFLRSIRVSIFLAIRSLWRGNKGITVLTITMLALIYINLLFLPSLIEGLGHKVGQQLIETLTSNVIVSSSNSSSNIAKVDETLTKIKSNTDVNGATPTLRIGTQISKGDISNVWSVDAVDPASFSDVFTTPNNMIEGSFLDKNDTDSIVLGVEIAGAGQTGLQGYAISLKNVHAGDTVTVSLINGKTHDFTVKGIFNNNFLQSDQRAYISQNEASLLLPTTINHATSIYVKSKGAISDTDLGNNLTSVQSGIRYQTSDDLAGSVRDQLKTFDMINQILKIISLVVAAITVFIVTYVDLINKRKQIGIERAIGIGSRAIVGNYLLKSLFFAAIGISIGSLTFLYVIAPLVIQHPFKFPYGYVSLYIDQTAMIQNAIILAIVAFISSLVPAVQSVRIKILDAIWGI
ncbi:MAG: ABC transporter permease [Candidatus Saccharibacteria bacterium]